MRGGVRCTNLQDPVCYGRENMRLLYERWFVTGNGQVDCVQARSYAPARFASLSARTTTRELSSLAAL